jgi:hypothetical protein
MQNLLQSVETNLALATFAEKWEWKEAEAQAGVEEEAHADT